MPHPTFTRALVRPPTPSMIAGLTTQSLGTPIFEQGLQQHAAYVETLRRIGLRVTALAGDDRYPDGCFVEDTAILHNWLAVITQPGALSRRGETEAIEEELTESHPGWQFAFMSGEEHLDGGDVLICADQTGNTRVMIGVGQRTNLAGANRLRDALLDHESNLQVNFVPFTGMLHLKSGINDIAPGVVLLAPELQFDPAHLDLSAFTVHTLPTAESYAANVVVINDHVLIPAGYSIVAQIAAQYYDSSHIHALEMSEFAKIDGGLTCLSLRF